MKTPWDTVNAEDVVGLVGVAAVSVGAALIYFPAGLIVIGVLFIAAAFLWAGNR